METLPSAFPLSLETVESSVSMTTMDTSTVTTPKKSGSGSSVVLSSSTSGSNIGTLGGAGQSQTMREKKREKDKETGHYNGTQGLWRNVSDVPRSVSLRTSSVSEPPPRDKKKSDKKSKSSKKLSKSVSASSTQAVNDKDGLIKCLVQRITELEASERDLLQRLNDYEHRHLAEKEGGSSGKLGDVGKQSSNSRLGGLVNLFRSNKKTIALGEIQVAERLGGGGSCAVIFSCYIDGECLQSCFLFSPSKVSTPFQHPSIHPSQNQTFPSYY
jgi:hypothetical protein